MDFIKDKRTLAGIALLILSPVWFLFLAFSMWANGNWNVIFTSLAITPLIIGFGLLASAKFSKTEVEVKEGNKSLSLLGKIAKTFCFIVAVFVAYYIVIDLSGWWLEIKSLNKEALKLTAVGLIALLYSFKK